MKGNNNATLQQTTICMTVGNDQYRRLAHRQPQRRWQWPLRPVSREKGTRSEVCTGHWRLQMCGRKARQLDVPKSKDG